MLLLGGEWYCTCWSLLGWSSSVPSFETTCLCPRPRRIGKQFEFTLLLQSVVMIATMLAMLHLCCVFHNTNRMGTKQHRLAGERF